MRMRTAALALAVLAIASCRGREHGLVVVEAGAHGAAGRAGLRPGDVLVAWSRGDAGGALATPLELSAVEADEGPKGGLQLRARRGWRTISVALPPGAWDLRVRPALSRTEEAAFRVAAAAHADPAGAAARWSAIAGRLAGDDAAWAFLLAGRAWLDARRPADAHAAFASAASAASRPEWRALVEEQAGAALQSARAPADAEAAYRRALGLRETVAPRSLGAARCRQMLGRLARVRFDSAAALGHFEAARALLEAAAPGSPELALVVHDIGQVAYARGRFEEADASYAAAQAQLERSVPDSLDLAATLSIRGSVAQQRGDFGRAEALHRRALALTERWAPESADHALVLNRLGVVTREQGDLDEAEAFHRRALAIFERTAPGGVEVAGCFNNLALVAYAREDLAAAEGFHQQALAIRERLKPDGADVAASLANLGAVASDRGDYAASEAYLRRSLAIKRTTAPGTLTLGVTLHNLGETLLGLGRYRDAREALEESRALRERLAPGSGDLAADWHSLGHVDLREGRPEDALAKWRRALDIMDAQRGKLAGTDRARFARRYAVLYRDPEALFIERGQAADAFAIHERFHARALLALLAGRGQADAPPATPPLDLAGVRAALDRGAALLAYGLLRDSIVLFVVRAAGDPGPPVTVVRLPFDEAALRARVLAFRGLLERGREAPALEPALLAQGERLYADLLRPAEPALEGATRLLVSPDGPLHLLPFAALVRSRAPLQFVAEWKPVTVTASASVFAEIKKSRRSHADPQARLVAFGDPILPAGLSPLPHSRQEVDQVAGLFGGAARAYLGPGATERQVLASAPGARFLHFATHGLLDARAPLDSALVLSVDGGDDGLLRAWEVRDRLRLDADLVTLSACESALGQEATAEGLVGLTRAFQRAGARSVVASLWAVTDRPTARFMESFYRRLRTGMDRDRALAEAQVESRGAGVHPYHWSAFQLAGDWR
jgi:CHAT domain-containing protein/tetratricopeptide (TPR) repeat protein